MLLAVKEGGTLCTTSNKANNNVKKIDLKNMKKIAPLEYNVTVKLFSYDKIRRGFQLLSASLCLP